MNKDFIKKYNLLNLIPHPLNNEASSLLGIPFKANISAIQLQKN